MQSVFSAAARRTTSRRGSRRDGSRRWAKNAEHYGKPGQITAKRSLRSPRGNTGGGSLFHRFWYGLALRITSPVVSLLGAVQDKIWIRPRAAKWCCG
jgi:hypothetical protein